MVDITIEDVVDWNMPDRRQIVISSLCEKWKDGLYYAVCDKYKSPKYQLDVKIANIGTLMKHLRRYQWRIDNYIEIPALVRLSGNWVKVKCWFYKHLEIQKYHLHSI